MSDQDCGPENTSNVEKDLASGTGHKRKASNMSSTSTSGDSNQQQTPFRGRPRPEEGSMHAVVASDPLRYWVHPAKWTNDHLKHLNITIHPSQVVPTGVQGDSPPRDGAWDDTVRTVKYMYLSDFTSEREDTLRNWVWIFTRRSTLGDHIRFRYELRSVARVQLVVAFNHGPNAIQRTWAYLDKSYVREVVRFGKKNSPSTAAMMEILNLPIDPLYVAILIALAQRSKREKGHDARPTRVSLFIPVTSEQAEDDSKSTDKGKSKYKDKSLSKSMHGRLVTTFTEYSADITDEYLLKFDDPNCVHDGSLDIYPKTWSMEEFFYTICHTEKTLQKQNAKTLASKDDGEKLGNGMGKSVDADNDEVDTKKEYNEDGEEAEEEF